MRRYNNVQHDCANDGTCGQSIRDFGINGSNISFFDKKGSLITEVPILPQYSTNKHGNQLYKEAESKQFHYSPTSIYNILPNSFVVKHGYINYTIRYDNLSKQEQSQIETDIKTAYEAFKEKFCLENRNANYDITIHIFNNRSDYTKYNNLLGINEDGGPGYIIRGVTDLQNILTYKQDTMDFVLGHELGHIFQLRFSPSKEVQSLFQIDTELIANVIGREVEEKNYKAICKQMGVDEYVDNGWGLQFKYKDTTGSIYRQNLSEEEKFQLIQRIKDSGLDKYVDNGRGLQFKYKGAGTLFNVHHKENPSEEEKFQIIQDIKNSYKSLTSECDGLGNDSTTLSIHVDENKDISKMYFYNHNKNIFKQLDKTLINRGKPEEEAGEVKHTDTGEPMEHQPVLSNSKMINIEGTNFKLKVHYDQIDEKDLLMIEKYVNHIFHAYKEKYTLDVNANAMLESYIYNNVEDYHNAHPWTRGKAGGHAQGLNQYVPHKGSHFIGELLAHGICHSLNHYNQQNHGIPSPSCGHAEHDEASHFGWDLRKELEDIKLGDSQKEPNTEKSQKEQESNEVNSGSGKEKSRSQEELNKVEHTGSEKEEESKVEEEKGSQQDAQQPSNLLHNIIFPAIKYVVGSIVSFFLWSFLSKEEEQPDKNLSSLELNVNNNVMEDFVNNGNLSDDYRSPNDIV